jgi:tocopherol O-methyltransferase
MSIETTAIIPNEPSELDLAISSNFETPAPEPFISFNALKDRIRHHYEVCSDYYYSLW